MLGYDRLDTRPNRGVNKKYNSLSLMLLNPSGNRWPNLFGGIAT